MLAEDPPMGGICILVFIGAIGYFFGMVGQLAGELALYVALLCGSLVALVHSRRNPRAKQVGAVQP
jgi:hypothetical protein